MSAVFDHLLARHDEYKWDFVQIQLNYLDWKYAKRINPRNTDAEYLYGELRQRNIPAVIMEPLLGGRLSNVPGTIVARLKQREPEMSVASWAFRFAGPSAGRADRAERHDPHGTLAGQPAHLRSAETADGRRFREFLARDGRRQMMRFDTIPCNDCKYCMPCPYGLDIPAILLHLQQVPERRRRPRTVRRMRTSGKPGKPFWWDTTAAVPKLRQANRCIGCNQCSVHCPQRIDIPKELHRIDAYAERLKQGI